jgi:hypothetical protein
MKSRPWLMWALAFLVTLLSAVYQRMTGPTYPVRGKWTAGAEEVRFKLPRSYDGPDDAEVRLAVTSQDVGGTLEFKRYRSRDEWTRQPMLREGGFLVGRIPHQPAAGKVLYRVYLAKSGSGETALTREPLIIRFRGAVPPLVLYPHIVLMFMGMLYSTRSGLDGLIRGERTYRLALWTVLFLILGGLILGPVVQKFAFGTYWTGWPSGKDLTDNKTAAAFLFWILALWRLRKNPRAGAWAVAAAIIMLLVYAIPHSMLGSELDYTQG